jgi:hypothetical protein
MFMEHHVAAHNQACICRVRSSLCNADIARPGHRRRNGHGSVTRFSAVSVLGKQVILPVINSYAVQKSARRMVFDHAILRLRSFVVPASST